MPIVCGRDDEGAARAADRQRQARLRLLRPPRRRPGVVNGEVDLERIFGRVITARGEIAPQHVGRAFGVGGAVGEEQFYVVVEAEAFEAFEIAGQRDADHVGGDLFDLLDRQRAAARLVTHALGAARIGRRRGDRVGCRWSGRGHCKKTPTFWLLYRQFTRQLPVSSGGGLVSSGAGSISARRALRSAVFSSFLSCFSSLRVRAALARSARSLP